MNRKVFADKIKIDLKCYDKGYWTKAQIVFMTANTIAIYKNENYTYRFRTDECKYINYIKEGKIEEI